MAAVGTPLRTLQEWLGHATSRPRGATPTMPRAAARPT
ncbi:MAG TPA: hypothetical protein VGF91_22925 [Solirubrobacteraceae bacterium]